MTITSKPAGQVIGNEDVRADGDGYSISEAKRLTSIESIWNNPNAGSTACGRQQAYPTTQRALKYPDYVGGTESNPTGTGEVFRYNFFVNEVPNPAKGDVIKSWDVNTAVVATNKFYLRMTALGLNDPSGSYISGNVNPQPGSTNIFSLIETSGVNQLAVQWSRITSTLDLRNIWYDANNLCSRSCQVACQTACQTSCQGCNVSQCHNQKCGAH
jgi:hypothetical protein